MNNYVNIVVQVYVFCYQMLKDSSLIVYFLIYSRISPQCTGYSVLSWLYPCEQTLSFGVSAEYHWSNGEVSAAWTWSGDPKCQYNNVSRRCMFYSIFQPYDLHSFVNNSSVIEWYHKYVWLINTVKDKEIFFVKQKSLMINFNDGLHIDLFNLVCCYYCLWATSFLIIYLCDTNASGSVFSTNPMLSIEVTGKIDRYLLLQ